MPNVFNDNSIPSHFKEKEVTKISQFISQTSVTNVQSVHPLSGINGNVAVNNGINNISDLKIVALNVCGLNSKLKRPDFL